LHADKIVASEDGHAVQGLGYFTRNFSSLLKIDSPFISSFVAPYTNVMYVNLRKLFSVSKSNVYGIYHDFAEKIDSSHCIYKARWGDLPLWGAVLALAQSQVEFLPLAYFHQSHDVLIDGNVRNVSKYSRSGRFLSLFLLTYGGNPNTTLNARIS